MFFFRKLLYMDTTGDFIGEGRVGIVLQKYCCGYQSHSPSMKGTIGFEGTLSLPSIMVMGEAVVVISIPYGLVCNWTAQ